jgi:hypothetical protein
MGTILFLALAACPVIPNVMPVEVAREPVTINEVPAPARDTIERVAKGHPIHQLAAVCSADGSMSYQARVHVYPVDIQVAPNGEILGKWKAGPSGTGP